MSGNKCKWRGPLTLYCYWGSNVVVFTDADDDTANHSRLGMLNVPKRSCCWLSWWKTSDVVNDEHEMPIKESSTISWSSKTKWCTSVAKSLLCRVNKVLTIRTSPRDQQEGTTCVVPHFVLLIELCEGRCERDQWHLLRVYVIHDNVQDDHTRCSFCVSRVICIIGIVSLIMEVYWCEKTGMTFASSFLIESLDAVFLSDRSFSWESMSEEVLICLVYSTRTFIKRETMMYNTWDECPHHAFPEAESTSHLI
jgi:hypothetical protein